jgi:hypothetical protein
MKQKFILITVIHLTVSIFLTVLQSCQDLFTYDASICDIEFRGLTSTTFPDIQPDTMTKDIGFVITSSLGNICSIRPSFNLVTSCYATTKCAKWQNEFVQSSFKLSFDRQVIISGDTIAPNTDLFKEKAFTKGVEVKKSDFDCKYIKYTITLNSDLQNQTVFEQGIYNVSFTCNTNDSRTFNKQRQVVFKF